MNLNINEFHSPFLHAYIHIKHNFDLPISVDY